MRKSEHQYSNTLAEYWHVHNPRTWRAIEILIIDLASAYLKCLISRVFLQVAKSLWTSAVGIKDGCSYCDAIHCVNSMFQINQSLLLVTTASPLIGRLCLQLSPLGQHAVSSGGHSRYVDACWSVNCFWFVWVVWPAVTLHTAIWSIVIIKNIVHISFNAFPNHTSCLCSGRLWAQHSFVPGRAAHTWCCMKNSLSWKTLLGPSIFFRGWVLNWQLEPRLRQQKHLFIAVHVAENTNSASSRLLPVHGSRLRSVICQRWWTPPALVSSPCIKIQKALPHWGLQQWLFGKLGGPAEAGSASAWIPA